MMLMYRVASSALVLALAIAVFPHGAAAQYAGDPTENRAPRFLLAMAERSQPVPVDLARSAVLRRRLSLAFNGATLKQALAEISRQAGLSLVYADDVLPAGMLVNLRAERITVAAALTDVLLGAGVDIVFTPEGRGTLVKRPEGEPVLQPGTITGTVTAAGTRAPLSRAIVSVVGTRLSADADATGHYTLSGVPVGTQRVRARMLGYAAVDTSVVVTEGQETVLDLQLKVQAIELEAGVAGGGVAKKSEKITRAVASVSPEALGGPPPPHTAAGPHGAPPRFRGR